MLEKVPSRAQSSSEPVAAKISEIFLAVGFTVGGRRQEAQKRTRREHEYGSLPPLKSD